MMWEILFKVNLIIVPLVIAWAVWATSNIYELKGFAARGDRFTQADGYQLKTEMREWVTINFPPSGLRDDIKEVRADIKLIKDDQTAIRIMLIKGGHEQ